MKSYIAMAVLCMLASCAGTGTKKGEANTEEPKDSTFAFVGNPIVKNKFTADPAPMVHDGRLYLYVGHDEYYAGQDSASGGKEFNITRERIRQIEAKALRKLRHPSRSKKLKDFLD